MKREKNTQNNTPTLQIWYNNSMIVLYIIGVTSMMFVSVIIGVAHGYGQGYEDCMLDNMTEKQKEKYLQNKLLLKQWQNKSNI